MEGLENIDVYATTRLSSRISFVRIFERYVTKIAPNKALKLIASDKLTFD